MSRDPVEAHINLHGYVANNPATYVDPAGLRAIKFAFQAFIHERFGTWVPEPFPFGRLGYYFKTDMRGFGESGSSRLFSEGSIESTKIGKVTSANMSTDTGWSYRGYWSDGEWQVDAEKAEAESSHDLYNVYDMRTDPTTCSTVVVIEASASYPFLPSPSIDYHVSFEFTVIEEDRVEVTVNGVHDAFPCFEGLVDGGLLYEHDTTWSGPGTGLTFGYLFGQSIVFASSSTIVEAETDPCCAI